MTEWVLVPREPTAKMVLAAFDAITNASGEGMIRARWRCMLDAAPAAPQQAEPVAWVRNLTDPQPHCVTGLQYRTAADADAGVQYIPVYLHPPAAELARLRAENERLRGDNVHLRGHFERAWPDTQRYRWLRATNMEQQNILAHYAYTEMDAAIDAAMAQGDKA